jgi:hypothetical protein
MRLETAQIVQSAQAWECTSCGGRDPKSCSCNSTAIMVALREAAEKHEARREADRQRKRRDREMSADADVGNVEELAADEQPPPYHAPETRAAQPDPREREIEKAATAAAHRLIERAPDIAREIHEFTDDHWWPFVEALRRELGGKTKGGCLEAKTTKGS